LSYGDDDAIRRVMTGAKKRGKQYHGQRLRRSITFLVKRPD
jgi:hypothetical protein